MRLIEDLDNTRVSVNNLKREIIRVNESGGDTRELLKDLSDAHNKI